MLKSIGILLFAAAIVFFEVPPLLEKKRKKELLLFSVFLTLGIGLSVIQAFGKTIPNPMDLLTFIFKPLNDVIAFLLK